MDIGHLKHNILKELVGTSVKKSNLIKINAKNLCDCGDLCFSSNLLAWKSLLQLKNITDNNEKNTTNILEHYLKKNNIDTVNYPDKKITAEALNLLILNSKSWIIPLHKGFLYKEKICLHLNRRTVISGIIYETLKCGADYGKFRNDVKFNKTVILQVYEDPVSDLTNCRLRKLKNICDYIFCLQGYTIRNTTITEECSVNYNYILTTKSEGKYENGVTKYICGVIKNPENNSKETSVSYNAYLKQKINELVELNGYRQSGIDQQLWLNNYKIIAEAIITFEFFSVKPSQPVFIKTNNFDADKKVTSNKGGAFILYNNTRISAILDKYEEEKLAKRYPELWEIDDVDFTTLCLEEEWELIYNFILGYPLAISNAIECKTHHELNPQIICLFLSQLSQKFSIYYRRTRILTEGRAHLIPTLMARLYLLKTLQIIYNNAFNVLDINPISRM